jgi:hypothetical protein
MVLPIPYVAPQRYSSATSTGLPIFAAFLRAGAIMGLEWTTLKFIEDAPLTVRITTFVISLLALAVVQCRDWLNFKRWWYFRAAISGLIIMWITVVGLAYIYELVNPAPSVVTLADLDNAKAQVRAAHLRV